MVAYEIVVWYAMKTTLPDRGKAAKTKGGKGTASEGRARARNENGKTARARTAKT